MGADEACATGNSTSPRSAPTRPGWAATAGRVNEETKQQINSNNMALMGQLLFLHEPEGAATDEGDEMGQGAGQHQMTGTEQVAGLPPWAELLLVTPQSLEVVETAAPGEQGVAEAGPVTAEGVVVEA